MSADDEGFGILAALWLAGAAAVAGELVSPIQVAAFATPVDQLLGLGDFTIMPLSLALLFGVRGGASSTRAAARRR